MFCIYIALFQSLFSKHFDLRGFAFAHSHTHTHTHTHTLEAQGQEQFGVQHLGQGHLNMLIAGSGIKLGNFQSLNDRSAI